MKHVRTAEEQQAYRESQSRAGRVRAACAERGIRILDLGNGAVRLVARDIDVMAVDLKVISEQDLQPFGANAALRADRARRYQRAHSR